MRRRKRFKVDLGARVEDMLAFQEKEKEALRDQFGMLALDGMLKSAPICDRTKIDKKKWAKIAYEWADAMMEARKPKRK